MGFDSSSSLAAAAGVAGPSRRYLSWPPARPFLAAGTTFAVCLAVAQSMQAWSAAGAWMAQAVLKTALIGFALAAARAQGLSWAECGFVRATPGWAGKVWLGALCGALATLAILGLGGSGAPLMRQLGLPGIVLWVWLYSSVSEEIFVRGWFQGLLSRGTDAALGTTGVALASAAMFSFLHLSLVLAGADLVTVGAVLAGTFALGWVCARARQQHGGLWPAIAAHIAFNVGGLLAGGAFVVAREAISMAVPR